MVNILRACESCGLWFKTENPYVVPPERTYNRDNGRYGGVLYDVNGHDIEHLLDGGEMKCPACRKKPEPENQHP